MNILKKLFFILCLYAVSIQAQEPGAEAKVVMLRGQAEVLAPNQPNYLPLRHGDVVIEKSKLRTGPKSFVKLAQGENTLSLGPESELEIGQFPKSQAGTITLLRGQLRSQINKGSDHDKVKLVVKTPSAAMGVRGTEFQVVYNDTQSLTSLVTFSGEVAMAPMKANMDFSRPEQTFNTQQSVSVTEGQYSGTMTGKELITLPVKISPAQFNSLKRNGDMVSSESAPVTEGAKPDEGKNFKSPIPNKAMAKSFMSDDNSLQSELSAQLGSQTVASLNQEMKAENSLRIPPEGLNDPSRGQFAPPAGGLIDVKTGLYIPPPPGSQFDPNTQVYVPPKQMGGIDHTTGEYVPPAGHTLNANGTFISSVVGANDTGAPKIIGTNEYGQKNFAQAQVRGDIGGDYAPPKDGSLKLAALPEKQLNELEKSVVEGMNKIYRNLTNQVQRSQTQVKVHLSN